MQSNLEKQAITKRKQETATLTYNETNGYSEDVAAKKSGIAGGMSHIDTDSVKKQTTSGGSKDDINGISSIPYSGRNGNIQINKYNSSNIYSDVDNILIDTSLNVGQVKIY